MAANDFAETVMQCLEVEPSDEPYTCDADSIGAISYRSIEAREPAVRNAKRGPDQWLINHQQFLP
jgi:hypothetical protein